MSSNDFQGSIIEEERSDLTESRKEITSEGYRFVMIWAACLLILYAVGATFGVARLRGYAARDWFSPLVTGKGRGL